MPPILDATVSFYGEYQPPLSRFIAWVRGWLS